MTARARSLSFILLAATATLLAACGTPAVTPASPAADPSPTVIPSADPSPASGGRDVAGTITVAEGVVASGQGFTVQQALDAGDTGGDPTLVTGVLFRETDGTIYLANSITDDPVLTFESPMLEVLNMDNTGENWDMANAELLGLDEADGIVFNANAQIMGFVEVDGDSDEANAPISADAVVAARTDGLRIRATPGLDGDELGTLYAGSQSIVVDGPELVDGLEWYLLSGLGLPNASGCVTALDPSGHFICPMWLGWAARADADGAALLLEVQPACVEPSDSLEAFAFQQRYLYAACYGDETVTLRGHLVIQPGGPVQNSCPTVPADLRWLGCVMPTYQLASTPDAGMGLVMTFAPGADLPADGGPVVVEGHFNDPASADCTFGQEPERSVLDCRAQFVVDAVEG